MIDTTAVIDHYRKLQAEVLKGLEEYARRQRRKFWRARSFLGLWAFISYLLVAGFGIAILLPGASRLAAIWINTTSEGIIGALLAQLRTWLTLLILLVWFAPYSLSLWLAGRPRTRGNFVLLITQFLIINPFLLTGAAYIIVELPSGRTDLFQGLIEPYALVVGTLLVLAPSILLTLALLGLDIFTPTTLLLVLSVESHDRMMAEILENARGEHQDWSKEMRQAVAALVERRAEDINLQVQTASFILGVLGLAGLLAVFVPPERISAVLQSLSGYFGRLSSSTIDADTISMILIGLLVILVCAGLWYFTQSYKYARALEITRSIFVLDSVKQRVLRTSEQIDLERGVLGKATPQSSVAVPILAASLLSALGCALFMLPKRSTYNTKKSNVPPARQDTAF